MRFTKLIRRKMFSSAALAALGLVATSAAGADKGTLFPDLTPQLEERVVCSISAAAKYQIPANIVLAVAEKEAGKPGQWVKNSNDTYDVGVMQFNTSYLSDLKKYGITAQDVAAEGCYAYDLAAWRLRKHILKDKGDLWTRAANYHSKTERYNSIYRADLKAKAATWADWLDTNFVTVNYAVSTKAAARAATAPQITALVSTVTPATALPSRSSMQSITSLASWRNSGYVSRKLIINKEP